MRSAIVLALCLASSSAASQISVVTDIPPIHSLAASIMEGVGKPKLLLPPGTSPHYFSLRPSDARSLQEADVIFWVGPELTPQLSDPFEALAPQAQSIELLDTPANELLPYRDSAILNLVDDNHHDHDHTEDKHDDHDHDAHHDHAAHETENHEEHHEHKDEHGHDEHAHEHHHDHDGNDPHAWLSPENAQVWLDVMTKTLAEADADNAETYRSNAERTKNHLKKVTSDIQQKLQAAGAVSYVVYHDAYQYFEHFFDVPSRGAILVSDAAPPSAARIAKLRAMVQQEKVSCVFSEPQFQPKLINAVFESGNVRVSQIDPLGALIPEGPSLYENLLLQISDQIAQCQER